MEENKTNLWHLFLPKFLKKKLTKAKLKADILQYYASIQTTEEEREVVRYLAKNDLSVFPYTFQQEYNRHDIKVFTDSSNGLHYVLQDQKRLYFKRSSSRRGIKRNYNFLRIEQDEASPHRYLTNTFNVAAGDILADVGAAEGNFTLSVIEKVEKAYLFEADKEWIEALEATFAPWKDKVQIIHKFVSDKDDRQHVSLDTFFATENVSFLKIDVEGMERTILKGGSKMLSADKPLKVALCTYHRQNDAAEFDALLKEKSFATDFSKGFMLFLHDKELSAPYLRRGLVRASR